MPKCTREVSRLKAIMERATVGRGTQVVLGEQESSVCVSERKWI